MSLRRENVNRGGRPSPPPETAGAPPFAGTIALVIVHRADRQNADFSEIVGLGMKTRANDLRTSSCQGKGEYMRRVGDVLQPLLSEVDELGRNRSPHMPPCIGGDADSSGRGETFQTRR
jgi:hypothetical protein